MTIKNYAIIKKTTNIVLLTVEGEETQVLADYDGFDVVEISTTLPGVRNITAGMLYHDSKFWLELSTIMQNAESIISKLAFRKLFTTNELVLIDNYQTDESLSLELKSQFKTFLVDIDSRPNVTLTSSNVNDYLTFLVSIGYINDARKAAIVAGSIV